MANQFGYNDPFGSYEKTLRVPQMRPQKPWKGILGQVHGTEDAARSQMSGGASPAPDDSADSLWGGDAPQHDNGANDMWDAANGPVQQPVPQAPQQPVPQAPQQPNETNEQHLGRLMGLTPQEIKDAEPGFWEKLGSGRPTSELTMNHMIQAANIKTMAARAQRSQEVQAQRSALFAANPPPVNGNAAQKRAWADAMTPGLIKLGDYDGVKELSAYGKTPPNTPAGAYFKNDTTGEVRSFGKEEGTSIPAGWSQMKTSSGQPPRLWIDPKTNKYYSMDDVDPTTASKMGLRSEEDYRAQFNQGNVNDRFGVTTAKSIGEDFNKSPIVTQLAKQAESYGGFKATLAEARNANPSAYKALISQMAPTLDPGVTLRLGMLQFINKLDPSLMGEMKTTYQRMANGTYPKDQLDNVEKIVDRITRAHAAYYESLRSDMLKGTPGAAVHVRPTSVLYPGVDFSGTTPTGGASKPGVFNLKQWLKDNPPGGGQ